MEERWQSTGEVQAIATALPGISAQVHDRATATHRLLSGSPTLRDVDNLTEKWRQLRTQLEEWSDLLTKRATALDKELGGFDELRGIWKATGDLARAQNAPSAVRERIDAAGEPRHEPQGDRAAQPAVARAAGRGGGAVRRDARPLRELGNIRRQSFGRC